jgi:hypothetical protein
VAPVAYLNVVPPPDTEPPDIIILAIRPPTKKAELCTDPDVVDGDLTVSGSLYTPILPTAELFLSLRCDFLLAQCFPVSGQLNPNSDFR